METVRSWFLQSHPQCDCVAITGDSQTALFGGLGGRVRLARTGEWNALGIAPSNYVVFAQPGDLLHPSLAFVIALKTQEQSTTVLVWNSVMIDANCNSVFVQRPDRQRLTLLNHDYIGQDLAVRADYAAEFALRNGGSLKSLFARNFKTWLAWHPEARWTIQPEFLAVRRQADDSAISDEKQIPPEPPANFLFEPREFAGKNIILWPARKPSTISVVIPFRDKPEITLRALRSIERQRFTGQIDLVLVDNESDQEVRDGIETELKTMSFGSTARVLDYRYPFNHSRQCNIGARAARGEVLVFMNNDCELMEDNVLDGLARWALLDGVASVGCRLVAPSGDLISAGIVARSEYGANDSPVEESRESQLSELVREVTGNTFALSAVRRDTFFALGALDELLFPAGYNDVDYCLRAIERRYSHVYLGPLTAAHQPGTSRGKSDERLQRIAIRERHSSVLYRSLVEWRIRKVAAKPERRSLARTISGFGRTIRRHIGS
jgi:GT2 family glycosyltransferase